MPSKCSYPGCDNDATLDLFDKNDVIIMSLCPEHFDDMPECDHSEDN